MADWAFLTSHAHVLLCVAREPDTRLRHIAERVGITERATHRIVSDLVEAGYLTGHRLGRRNCKVIRGHPICHDRSKEHGAFATPPGRPRR